MVWRVINKMDDTKAPNEYQNDHDVLIEVRTVQRGMREDIQNLTKAIDVKTLDHETRIRDLEGESKSAAASAKTWRLILGISVPLIVLALGWVYVDFSTLESTLDKRISTAITLSLRNYSLIK